jgi:ABC-type molybdate transport system substrate-binding protein
LSQLFFTCTACTAQLTPSPAPLSVLAASLTGAFGELGAQFEAAHPGVKLDFAARKVIR